MPSWRTIHFAVSSVTPTISFRWVDPTSRAETAASKNATPRARGRRRRCRNGLHALNTTRVVQSMGRTAYLGSRGGGTRPPVGQTPGGVIKAGAARGGVGERARRRGGKIRAGRPVARSGARIKIRGERRGDGSPPNPRRRL